MLNTALEFSPDDLEANRAGHLSEMQNYHLRVKRQRSIFIGLALIFVMAFIATLCIFVGQRSDSSVLMIIGIGVTIISAAMTGVFARYWMRVSSDIGENKVLAISGKIELVAKVHVRFRTVTYFLRIGQTELMVPKEIFNAFEQGKTYRLYRTPYSGMLLSAEQL
jgi:hypothetical protein